MTVRELIDQLSDMPDDAEVELIVYDDEGGQNMADAIAEVILSDGTVKIMSGRSDR